VPPGPFTITSITNTQGLSTCGRCEDHRRGWYETWTVALKSIRPPRVLFQQPLTIASSDPGPPVHQLPLASVSLIGTGATPPHLSTPTGPITFGSVPADGAGKQLSTRPSRSRTPANCR